MGDVVSVLEPRLDAQEAEVDHLKNKNTGGSYYSHLCNLSNSPVTSHTHLLPVKLTCYLCHSPGTCLILTSLTLTCYLSDPHLLPV